MARVEWQSRVRQHADLAKVQMHLLQPAGLAMLAGLRELSMSCSLALVGGGAAGWQVAAAAAGIAATLLK